MSSLKKNDTLAIIGFALNTRDLAPWTPNIDNFTLNERYNSGKWVEELVTAHFQMHPYSNFMRVDNPNDPNHPQWMRTVHKFPVFTQEKYVDVPSSVKYPLHEAIKIAGASYLTSSFSYMMAMGMLLDYKRIEIYGFNMGTGTEYGYQKPGAEYLIGVAKGRGIDVYIPEESKLLKDQLYGYDNMDIPFLQHFEMRKASAENECWRLKMEWFKGKGGVDLLRKLKTSEFGSIIEPYLTLVEDQEAKATRKIQAELNSCIGASDEIDYVIEQFKKHMGERHA